MFFNIDSAKAEIIGTLIWGQFIMGGCSVCFNDDLNHTFAAMFAEFEIVTNFGLARTKSVYVINCGLAPYFKRLVNLISEKSGYFI